MILQDNHWHKGVLYETQNGFCLDAQLPEDILPEAPNAPKPDSEGQCHFTEVHYNWNKGQPLVRLDDGEIITIVDLNTTIRKAP